MSIVVTCSCTRTYHLPDRYAGKRCRCRECGKKIEVPSTQVEAARVEGAQEAKARRQAKAERRARRAKAKDDPSRATTRRLSSQDREILGERRRIRSSQRARVQSESMHQLAPMTLSGDLAVAPPRKKPAPEPVQSKTTKAPKAPKPPEAPKTSKREAKRGEASGATSTRKGPRSSKKKGSRDAKKGSRGAKEPADRAERRAKGKAEAGPLPRSRKNKRKKQKKQEAVARATTSRAREGRAKAEAARGKRAAAVAPGRRRERDDEVAAPRGRKPAHRLPVVIGIAGALCLGIGLVIGGLVGSRGGAPSPALAKRLDGLDALKANRQWAAAEAEVVRLVAELEAAGDTDGLARVRATSGAIKKMAVLSAIEDEETRLLNLLPYATDADPAVRLGVAHELRALAEADEAQRALVALAGDADPRVAEAARHGLVQVGGPHSIPYLGRTIEETAASGHKLGDVALERALELYEPEIVPVLITALKHRANAPANVLRAILDRLAELPDASAKDAVTPFTTHADEGVAAAAKAALEAIGG